MKTLKSKFAGALLSREQMQKISGGVSQFYDCVGQNNYTQTVIAENCCQAQGLCDAIAFNPAYTNWYPTGGDVVCGDDCD